MWMEKYKYSKFVTIKINNENTYKNYGVFVLSTYQLTNQLLNTPFNKLTTKQLLNILTTNQLLNPPFNKLTTNQLLNPPFDQPTSGLPSQPTNQSTSQPSS